MRKILLPVLGLLVAIALTPPSARADDDDDDDAPGWSHHHGHDRDDHDRARRAMLAGEILPLSRILDRVEREFGGELLEAELESRHGEPVYEIKLIGGDGRMRKLLYDARDGRLLKSKERP